MIVDWPKVDEFGTMPYTNLLAKEPGSYQAMIDELEALVGHVFIVGGRAVSATPPGALVELPPKKAQRGRDQDTFFTLVTPTGPTQGQAAFYEQLSQLAAGLYFRSSGSVTSGLRDVVNGLNSHLLEHNRVAGQRYEVSVTCLVLRSQEVYMARCGACLCLLRQGDSFTTYPEDLRDEYIINNTPLGRGPVLDIKLSRHEVTPGHVMVLSDPGFMQAERDKLFAALGGGSIQTVIELLKPLGKTQAQAMIVAFTSVNAPDPVVLTPLPGAKVTRSSAVVSKPVSSPVPTSKLTSVPPRKEIPAPVGQQAETPLPPIPSTPVTLPVMPPAKLPSVEVAPEIKGESVLAESPADAEVPTVSETATSTAPPTLGTPSVIMKVINGVATVLETLAKILTFILNRFLPEPQEGGPKIPSMLAAALAVLVPIVVVFVVVAVRLAQVDLSQFEKMVHDIEQRAQQAASIPTSDVKKSKAAWQEVIKEIDNAEAVAGRANDPILERSRAQAQDVLDTYAQITRRVVTPLRSFNEGARLIGPIIRAETDMYTLDETTSSLYRDTLSVNPPGLPRASSVPVVTQGQAVSAYTVRRLVGMTWVAEGGTLNKNVIATLDTQGIFVTYSPTFAPAISQRMAGSDLWGRPVAIHTWRDRLYILDPAKNQLWRYVPIGNSYPNPPTGYFEDNTNVDLSNAVDFGIDDPGTLYILFSDGTIKKYNSGVEEQPKDQFKLNGVPEDGIKSANAMYMDTDNQKIYIVDPNSQAIWQVTFAGTFQYRFQPTAQLAFKNATGVFADHNHIYVASGNFLYYFSTDDLTGPTPPTP